LQGIQVKTFIMLHKISFELWIK